MLDVVECTLTDQELELYTIHTRRFLRFLQITTVDQGPALPELKLFLFRNAWQYSDFLDRLGIGRDNSGGAYFRAALEPGAPPLLHPEGVALWMDGLGVLDVYRLIQHECFHFVASHRYAGGLPRWLDEGLANYYGDGVCINGRFEVGHASPGRLARCQAAIKAGYFMPLSGLIQTTPAEWSLDARADHNAVGRLYDQAWSLVWFMMHGQGGTFQPALEQHLEKIRFNQGWPTPLHLTDRFEHAWRASILAAEPTPLAITLERMSIVALMLDRLRTHMDRLPESARECRLRMQMHGIELLRPMPGGRTERIRGGDESLYMYMTEDGLQTPFEMQPRAAPGLLPTFQAAAAPHSPAMIWRRITGRILLPEIVFDQA